MSEIFSLARLKVGQIGEIVELKEEALVHKLGIGKGMSVIVLQQAVDWLVQIGYNQLFLSKDTLNKIHVKEVNV
ncbi:FeoA domain-containing protein [Desulfonispora thiosulfatigenes DSM 11270]|uniref:FeoA domain-containing protein n=1 Tax=Desulfonispora thiosulfatigenes DSM 11270 TaxID=656914 RepID=A0A1W1VGZ2_DESTI|nr:FeoA domain-containing protein [Desulfonispora thiosulfatigenes]SMB92224.1 FeoA domain-containing protein [Desulfonispora thiosulfatigenes DSM 11270]